MGEFAIGQGVSRFEDPRLLRGGGRYTDDVTLPGMAHGVVLRSPHAHAAIKLIDTSAAKAAPGVLAVLTSDDIKAARLTDLPRHGGLKRRDGSPMPKTRYPILAEGRVRWVGDCVAFVVAETVAQAMDAAELIAVDYEPLPAVTSTAAAVEPGAPHVWDECPDNICFTNLIGDKAAADAAFAKAAHIIKHRIRHQPRHRRRHGAARRGRRIQRRRRPLHDLYADAAPAHVTPDLAKLLGVPESKVHIITGDTGGGFGMKALIFNETPLVLLASKLTGRPVKWISTRTEAFLSDAQARDNVTDAELALDKQRDLPCHARKDARRHRRLSATRRCPPS